MRLRSKPVELDGYVWPDLVAGPPDYPPWLADAVAKGDAPGGAIRRLEELHVVGSFGGHVIVAPGDYVTRAADGALGRVKADELAAGWDVL